MLALEAVRARHGDCLILHWGSASNPDLVLIDGGPDLVYREFLRPRLLELRQKFAGNAALRISLVMLSHIDDDHIQGLLDLTNGIADRLDEQEQPEFHIRRLWHNSFEDLIDDQAVSTVFGPAVLQSVLGPIIAPADQATAAVLTSIPQGVRLRDNARRLNLMIPMNEPFGGIVAAGVRDVPVMIRPQAADEDALRLRVIAPSERRIAVLRRKWSEWQRRHSAKPAEALTAAYADRSVYNMSSIVVLAQYGGRSILLTGDARGDDVLQGLETQDLLREKPYRVDVLKLPHHGSTNNVTPEFFEQIVADHYMVSGDQKAFPNPQRQTFEWIKAAREKILPGQPYDVWLTYDCNDITSLFQSGPGHAHFPPSLEKSITVSLDT